MRNTTLSQGVVAKTLHWLTALGFPAVYCTIYHSRLFEINADGSQLNYFIQPRIPRKRGVRLAGFQKSFVLILTGWTGRLLGVTRASSVSMSLGSEEMLSYIRKR